MADPEILKIPEAERKAAKIRIRLIPVEAEQAILRRIVADKAAGKGYRIIARSLNEEGVKSKTGGKWWPATVTGVLERQEKAA